MRKNPDNAYRLLAAESILRWLEQLTDRIDGVAGGDDPEDIHRMRVASRRLRTAMSLFQDSLPNKRRKAWRKRIRQVTKHLGPARDLDVQITFVESFLQRHDTSNLQPGLEALLEELRARRADLQPGITAAMGELRQAPTLQDMRDCVEKIRRDAASVEPAACSEASGRLAGAKVMRRLRELLCHEPCVIEPDAVEAHHDMRIAAKRLRYAMELLNPIWGQRLDHAITVVKGFQRSLGTVHDCDVWLGQLPEFLRDHPREDSLRPGVHCLIDHQRNERTRQFELFVDHWRRCQAERFWEDLYRLLHTRPKLAGSAETLP